MEDRLIACRGGMLIFMDREIKGKLARIGRIGTEAHTADRAGVFAGPDTFALPVCHDRPEADFFGEHAESLHRFHEYPLRKISKLLRNRMLIRVEFPRDIR